MKGRPIIYRDKVLAEFDQGNFNIEEIMRKTGVSKGHANRLRMEFRRRRNLANRMSPREIKLNPEPFTLAIVRGCFLHNWPLHKAASMSGLPQQRVAEIYKALEETKFRDLYA